MIEWKNLKKKQGHASSAPQSYSLFTLLVSPEEEVVVNPILFVFVFVWDRYNDADY